MHQSFCTDNTLRNWYSQKSSNLVLMYSIKIKVPLGNLEVGVRCQRKQLKAFILPAMSGDTPTWRNRNRTMGNQVSTVPQ